MCHTSSPSVKNRGAAALTMLLLMLGLASILGLVEIGYIYWLKRDLQKIADVSAIAGAQRLESCNNALNDNLAARTNARDDNGFDGEIAIRCGYWDPATQNVVSAVPAGKTLDAVQVDVSKSAIPFFGMLANPPLIRARAIARSGNPVAAFSVGSRLLGITGNGPIQSMLRLVGLDLSGTEVASFRGLADVRVTPRGLLNALGIPVEASITAGDLNNLLAARQVSVGQLLDAVASIGAQQGVANVNVGLLKSRLAALNLQDAVVRLGNAQGNGGLFAGITAGSSANAALDTHINAFDLIDTSLQIANRTNAVSVPGLNLLGVVQARTAVIEPPSIAIGPVGSTAYNSQVRLHLDIDTNNIPVLGPALILLGTRVKLPIYVDVVDGFGKLSSIDCTSSPSKAVIDVTSSVANVCIGNATSPWRSTRELCSTGIQKEKLITVLGKTVLDHRLVLDALSSKESLSLGIGESDTTQPNSLALGDLTADLTGELLGTLDSLLTPGGTSSQNAQEIATRYLEATKHQHGYYQPALVIEALRNGHGALPPIGSWTTGIPGCKWALLVCIPETVQGDVWEGFRIESGISDSSVVGGLLDVLGITSCSGLITGILAYNPCVKNSLAKYLQTRPGGLQDIGNYDPSTGTGNCNGLLCTLLKPLINNTLRPLLNEVGRLLSVVLSELLGIELGQSVVTVHDIQCGNAELVY